MNSRILVFAVVGLTLLCVTDLHAEGAKNFDLSARAAALGGAFTARADDASAIFYNPAAIVFLEGIRIKTNLLVSNLTWSAYDPATDLTHKSSPFRLQGSFFLTWRATKWLGFGLGGFNPYQAASDWPWSWPGVTTCLRDSLSAYYIRPAISVRLAKFLSIGIGLDLVIARLRLDHVQRYGLFGYSDAYGIFLENRYNLKGKGNGYVLSSLLNFENKLRIGIRFHQKVTTDLSGDIWTLYWRDNVNSSTAFKRFHAEDYLSTPITVSQFTPAVSQFKTPSELAAGLMWKPMKKFLIHFEAEQIKWKEVGDLEVEVTDPSYFLDAEDPTSFGTRYHPDSKFISTLKRRDTLNLRAGLEYRLSPTFALRAGFASIQGAAADNMISPVAVSLDRRVISFGVGYEGPLFSLWSSEKISELSLDFYLQYVMGLAQSSALPGMGVVFNSDHLVIGLGVGLNIL